MLTLQGSHLGELRIAGEDRPRRLAHGLIDLECTTVAVGDTAVHRFAEQLQAGFTLALQVAPAGTDRLARAPQASM